MLQEQKAKGNSVLVHTEFAIPLGTKVRKYTSCYNTIEILSAFEKIFFNIRKLKGRKYYINEKFFKVGFQICVQFQKINGKLGWRASWSGKQHEVLRKMYKRNTFRKSKSKSVILLFLESVRLRKCRELMVYKV